MALLEVRQLARPPLFGARDLDLHRGQIVVLRGPTGSGKTLFLRAIADLDPSVAERVALEGEARTTLAPTAWRSRVVYVHQAGVRLPGTVQDNLERVAALDDAWNGERPPPVPGVPGERDALHLSGGEAQAMALHRALLRRPQVLLLDESTSAMDPQRAAFWEEGIRKWVDEGHAALWVAHDDRLADRIGARREVFA